VAHVRVTGHLAQRVEHVVEPHAPHAVQQRARVLQHDPRLGAVGQQLGNELPHPLVAPVEHRGVVVVADAGVLHHPLQVADRGRGAQVRPTGRDERLVHVQGDGEGAVDPVERRPLVAVHRPLEPGPDGGVDLVLRPAQVGQVVDVLGELGHGAPRRCCRYLCLM
jgi:hypothetical protein